MIVHFLGELSSDSDNDGLEYDDGFNDDLMGDEEDQARLAAMTEWEREEEINRRFEIRASLKRRHELDKRLKEREAKAVAETSSRSRERRLMIGSSKDSKSFDALRVKREEKRNKAAAVEKKKAAASANKPIKEESDSEPDEKEEDIQGVQRKRLDESDSDSDSELDEDSRKEADEKSAKNQPVDRLDALDKIWLSRDKLIHWMFYPKFLDAIKGCFVRVNCGDFDSNRQVIYRVS